MKINLNINQTFNSRCYFCNICGHKKILKATFDSNYCLNCKKKTNNNINLVLEDKIPVHDSVKLLRYATSKTKYLSKSIFGWFSSHKYKNGVNKEQIFDREKDYYKEELRDPFTGKILYKCEKPLSKHRGHGSAKFNKGSTLR